MYAKTHAASVFGITAVPVEIEIHAEQGLPGMHIVGLPDNSVREAKERVQAALKNTGFDLPPRRFIINLAPADVRKEGSAFDMAIAIGLLISLQRLPPLDDTNTVIMGELALDGTIRPVHGLLPVAMAMRARGCKRLLVPAPNAAEAAIVDDIDVVPMETLADAVALLNGMLIPTPVRVDVDALFRRERDRTDLDLRDVKGQMSVKRALEVAAAGGHNIIMIGPPGSGKTMIAKRLPGILPPLTLAESLETTKIHSVAGLLPAGRPLVTQRPFRAPHHTISDAALVGGGVGIVRAGEVSLAHHGVLFLDEVPEFQRNVLEVLRQPLEDKRICISRTKMTVEFPANVMLVCSMNPCPCGHYGNPHQQCQCRPEAVQKYMAKISGPLMDRIDIHVQVPAVKVDELSTAPTGEHSASIRARVEAARSIQHERFRGATGVFKNADMTSNDLRMHCVLDAEGAALLRRAMTSMGFSARAYDRIIKVARTIADLGEHDHITASDVAEAVQYRSLDRATWGL
ncbi:MAG: YifB family Mg chelatase-like AAA ATPase [Candidatus Kapabacteria bacterium]|nr:YifB family Mg chelatase-like AAA ATPase [Candidatus Kapabacteria bacterium]